MRDVTSARGLSNLRTATTNRVHAKPPQKGTEFLNLYLLDMEAQRLERELQLLEERRVRVRLHLAEIRQSIHKLRDEAQQKKQQAAPSVVTELTEDSSSTQDGDLHRWKRMDVQY